MHRVRTLLPLGTRVSPFLCLRFITALKAENPGALGPGSERVMGCRGPQSWESRGGDPRSGEERLSVLSRDFSPPRKVRDAFICTFILLD